MNTNNKHCSFTVCWISGYVAWGKQCILRKPAHFSVMNLNTTVMLPLLEHRQTCISMFYNVIGWDYYTLNLICVLLKCYAVFYESQLLYLEQTKRTFFSVAMQFSKNFLSLFFFCCIFKCFSHDIYEYIKEMKKIMNC